MSFEVFTLWIGEVLYGVDIEQVLAIRSDIDKLQSVPVTKAGMLGVTSYQGQPSPIFDLCHCLGIRSHTEERDELVATLTAREQDHIDWLDALEHSIKDGATFSKAKDPHKCAFGKWYDSFETRDQTLQDILEKFDEPHKAIHALAEKLLAMRDNEQIEEALEIIKEEREITLGKLRRLFDAARTQISDSSRQVIIYITDDGSTPRLGLIVDEVNDVVSYEDDELLPAERSNLSRLSDINMSESLLKGFIKSTREDKDDCFLFDPMKVMDEPGIDTAESNS
jgi:chemotaxis signal transduction protein